MNKVLKIIGLVIGVFFIILIAGCGIVLVSAGKSLNDQDKSGKNATVHMSQVQIGMTKAQVVSILGKPDSAQSMTSDYDDESCIYYGTLSSNDWQLCFTDGSLDSKNHY